MHSSDSQTLQLMNEQETLALGQQLARGVRATNNGALIYLQGELGSGKTTLTRGFLRGLGYRDKVKSPSYTLVEVYEIDSLKVFHFDFYRLKAASELIEIGIEEYLQPSAICLIEWPEKGADILPLPDLICELHFIDEGREVVLKAETEKGRQILKLVKVSE